MKLQLVGLANAFRKIRRPSARVYKSSFGINYFEITFINVEVIPDRRPYR